MLVRSTILALAMSILIAGPVHAEDAACMMGVLCKHTLEIDFSKTGIFPTGKSSSDPAYRGATPPSKDFLFFAEDGTIKWSEYPPADVISLPDIANVICGPSAVESDNTCGNGVACSSMCTLAVDKQSIKIQAEIFHNTVSMAKYTLEMMANGTDICSGKMVIPDAFLTTQWENPSCKLLDGDQTIVGR